MLFTGMRVLKDPVVRGMPKVPLAEDFIDVVLVTGAMVRGFSVGRILYRLCNDVWLE